MLYIETREQIGGKSGPKNASAPIAIKSFEIYLKGNKLQGNKQSLRVDLDHINSSLRNFNSVLLSCTGPKQNFVC